VGRLDNIIARNKRSMRPRERTLVSLAVGFMILLILGLAVFTDLGKPGGDPPAPPGPKEHRVNNILLVGPRNFVDAGADAADGGLHPPSPSSSSAGSSVR
jgi:hypothetical protein